MAKLSFTYDTYSGEINIGFDKDGKWILRLGTFDKEQALRFLDKELKECGF